MFVFTSVFVSLFIFVAVFLFVLKFLFLFVLVFVLFLCLCLYCICVCLRVIFAGPATCPENSLDTLLVVEPAISEPSLGPRPRWV